MNNADENNKEEYIDITPDQTPPKPYSTGISYPEHPVVSDPPVPQTPPVERRRHKGLVISLVAVTLLLIAAVTYVAYTGFFKPEPADTSTNNTVTTQEETKESDALAIIKDVRAKITDGLAKTYPDMKITDTSFTPAYQAKDADYAVLSDTLGHGITVLPIPATYDAASTTQAEQIATDTFTADKSFSVSTQEWQTVYENDTVICTISTGSSPVTVTCADLSVYDDLVTELKPFATAYLASEDGKAYGEGILLTQPKINEKSGGYKNATISMGSTLSPIGGYAGLFYAKNDTWTYWRGTQSVINCTDYNTHDLQKAFEGETCYDEDAADETANVKVTL